MAHLRSLGWSLLAATFLLAPGGAAADRYADAIAAAADRVIAAVRGGDANALRALAAEDDPDPWCVADLLLLRGAREAATAFAEAAPRPDLEALPAYVHTAADRPAEEPLRAALAASREAARARDDLQALRRAEVEAKGPDTVTTVRLAFARASAFSYLKRFAEGADAWEAAGAAALRLGWLSHAALGYGFARRDCWRIPDFKRALGFAERAHALEERRGLEPQATDALVHVGSVLDALGDQRRALEVMEQALARHEARGHRPGMATAIGNLGVIRHKLGELDEAVRLQERALALAEELKDRAQTARTLGRLALLLRERGDLPRALESSQVAAKELGLLGFGGEAALALVSASNIHRLQGNEARALGTLERALKVARQAGDGMAEARALFNLGSLRSRLGDDAESTRLKEEAMAIWERAGDRRALAGGLINLAGTHVDRRDAQRALPLLDRALQLAEELRSADLLMRVEMARAHALIGIWRPDEALRMAESATRRADQQGNLESIARAWLTLGDVRQARQEPAETIAAMRRSSEAARRMRLPGALVQALAGEARALRESKDDAGAIAVAREVAAGMEALSRGHDEESAAAARERGMRAMDDGVISAQTLNDADAVVFFLEAGRAGALLEALGHGDLLRSDDLPEELAQADAAARAGEAAALARFTRALEDRAPDVEAKGADLDAAREKRREASRRIQRWAKARGGGAAPGIASADEIRRALAPGDVLVLYGYVGAYVRAAVVRPDGVRVVTMQMRLPTEQAIEAAMPATNDVVSPEAVEAARAALLGPLDLGPEDRRLLISPDGPLDRVPFALLEPEREVVLVPSGSVLALLRARSTARGKGVLALGDPAYDAPGGAGGGGLRAGLGLPRLLASAAEARAVGDVVLLGANASEPGLREALATRSRWRAVHFACHGLIDSDRPLLSCLALAPSADDDGLLTGHEILRLAVPADLVVLSGCDTAHGKAFWGEGVLGLTRAFLMAGTPRVLASLWKVDDEATRVFMETLYVGWKQGEPLGAALRQARARLKADPRWSHPRHWSAFVLWGLPE